MDNLLMAVGLGLAVGFAILIQTGVLMAASGMASNTGLTFPKALLSVIIGSVITGILQVLASFGGGSVAFLGAPMSLMVWTGVISLVGDMKIGEAFMTAFAASVLQCVVWVGLAMMLGGWFAMLTGG